MNALLQDLRYAMRQLRKSPAFTAIAVLTIALGIGANTAIFTVIQTILLRGLPYPNADKIVVITRKGGGPVSVPMFSFWSERKTALEDLAAYDSGPVVMNFAGKDRPEIVQGLHVSKNYFPLFGARPIIGRTFTPDEDRPGGANVIVISYGLWERRFASDHSVVGHTVSFGGVPYTVVGILSPKFRPEPATDAWMPLQADPNSTNQAHTLAVAARISPGASLAEVNAQMSAVARQYAQVHPEQIGNDDQIEVRPMQQVMTGDIRPALLVLLGAVTLVLLIACANVANLLLVRAAKRTKEFALRMAIGARRSRIVTQLLVESVLLGAIGGALGLALGSAGLKYLLSLTPGDLPRMEELPAIPALNPWVAAFAILLSFAAAIVFGTVPLLHALRADINSTLKNSAGTGRERRHARSTLAVLEIATAVILLCGAALLIRTFAALHDQQLGFDPQNVLTMKVSLAAPEYARSSNVDRIAREATDRIERIPGVQSAAMVNNLPFEDGIDMVFNIPGRSPSPGFKFTGDEQWRFVTSHYFDVLRIPLLSGRLFQQTEPTHVVIINQAMARKYWPGANPVGVNILMGAGLGPEFEAGPTQIIGVVGNVREAGLDSDAPPVMYQLQSQVMDATMKLVNSLLPQTVIVRTQPGVAAMSVDRAVQAQLLSGDINLPATAVHTMDELTLNSTSRRNFLLLLLGVFAGIALLLAAIGIYGVISYGVEQRTREIGVRTALGANRAQLLRLVLGAGLKLILLGLGIGIGGGLVLTRFMSSLLFQVSPWDPLAFAASAVSLSAVALLACYIPARRAAKVDPMVALRYE